MMDSMAYPVAVVPIFVNAGTALVPALLAGAASLVAVLMRPRELVAVCRRRPMVPAVGVVAVAVLWWVIGALMGSGQAVGRDGRRDWTKEALQIMRREGSATWPVVRVEGANGRGAVVFRQDYGRCGHDGGPAPVGLRALWEYKEPDGAMMLSSPAVVGDRVYGASSLQNVDGKIYGGIYCVDAGTGKQIWATNEPLKAFFSSPALSADGKYLVIGQGLHDDKDCELLCLETESGKVHWRVKTTLHVEGSPAIHGDMVVVGAGAIEGPDHKPTTDPGEVIAVRISDGMVLWRCQVNDPESSPAISKDGIVYIGSGFGGNAMVALRSECDEDLKKNGLERVMWRTGLTYPVTGAVTLAGDRVIVGVGNSDFVYSAPHPAGVVAALDAKTGEVKWRTPMKDAVLGAVAYRDGKLICPVRTGEVVALNAEDGTEIWRQAVSGKSPVLAGPAFAGGYVYAVSRDGYLAVLDVNDGRVVERHGLNDPANPGQDGLSLSSPMVAGGCVFVGSETGGLRCFIGGKGGS